MIGCTEFAIDGRVIVIGAFQDDGGSTGLFECIAQPPGFSGAHGPGGVENQEGWNVGAAIDLEHGRGVGPGASSVAEPSQVHGA